MSELQLRHLFREAVRRYEAMTPEQRKAHDEAQRASFVRGMTTPCEHGVLDFEQCAECRAALNEARDADQESCNDR